MAVETRGHVRNYRIYTDVFVPENTHVKVRKSVPDDPRGEVNIDFYNMTLFLSRKKARELHVALNDFMIRD